jgi:hypothetical protein
MGFPNNVIPPGNDRTRAVRPEEFYEPEAPGGESDVEMDMNATTSL